MSEPIAMPTTGDDPPAGDGEMLQFDQAEFATPSADRPTCAVCHQPIDEEYFEINQKLMCPRCRQGVEAAFRGGSPADPVPQGDGVRRGGGSRRRGPVLRVRPNHRLEPGPDLDRARDHGGHRGSQRHGEPRRTALSVPRGLPGLFQHRGHATCPLLIEAFIDRRRRQAGGPGRDGEARTRGSSREGAKPRRPMLTRRRRPRRRSPSGKAGEGDRDESSTLSSHTLHPRTDRRLLLCLSGPGVHPGPHHRPDLRVRPLGSVEDQQAGPTGLQRPVPPRRSRCGRGRTGGGRRWRLSGRWPGRRP